MYILIDVSVYNILTIFSEPVLIYSHSWKRRINYGSILYFDIFSTIVMTHALIFIIFFT